VDGEQPRLLDPRNEVKLADLHDAAECDVEQAGMPRLAGRHAEVKPGKPAEIIRSAHRRGAETPPPRRLPAPENAQIPLLPRHPVRFDLLAQTEIAVR